MSSYDNGEAARAEMFCGLTEKLFRAKFGSDAFRFIAVADAAVAAIALLEFDEGLEEPGAIEIRPQGIGDENLRVGNLPEQEVADAHFAAGADEQIGVGEAGSVEVLFELGLGELFRGAGGALFGEDAVGGVHNFGAAAVVERDAQHYTRVFGGGFGGFASVALHRRRQFVGAAQKTHADVVFLDERHLLADVFTEQLHEKLDFGFGAAPVFHGEGVKSQRFNLHTGAGFDGAARGFRAFAVAGDAGEMAALGPAAVAVHDHGYVARQPG